jgi:hypothetical protein
MQVMDNATAKYCSVVSTDRHPRTIVLSRAAHESGHCWLVELPWGVPDGDGLDGSPMSRVHLLEDGIEVGPAHVLHDEIRKFGGGRYSHWRRRLYFSTSDNSSPLENARCYSIRVTAQPSRVPVLATLIKSVKGAAQRLTAALQRSLQRMGMRAVAGRGGEQHGVPVNFAKRSAEQIRDDVDYAIQIARSHLGHLSAAGLRAEGLRILELGPGVNFAPQLVLASMGARMSVADRFLAPWDDDYHPAFYRMFRERWGSAVPAIDRVLRDGAHSAEAISCFANPAEDLSGILPASVDLVISNAVLEHVYSIPSVCREMARVTAPGGLNLHQIDFRDHRDFTRPLEFLTMADDRFEDEFARRNGECGNRCRPSETKSAFAQAGFEVVSIDTNMQPEQSYFEEFLPRLRATSSRYRDWPRDDLMIISALLKLRRSKPW